MRKGFTLIEILVAVLIMGLLASIAFPQYQISVYKSRATEAINILNKVVAAQEEWYGRKNAYTANISDLPIDFTRLDGYAKYGHVLGCAGVTADGITRTCVISSSEPSMPNFEFHLMYAGPAEYRGKRWCSDCGKNSIAQQVCESLGKRTTVHVTCNSSESGNYYEIN